MVDENVAEHKSKCWDKVLICTHCHREADAAWIADGLVGNCDGFKIGWLTKHNWVNFKGGKMETTKEKSAAEKMIEEFTDLLERLYKAEGSPLWSYTPRLYTREERALRALGARVEALELAQKELDERERLKGIVREVLAERRDGTFDPTGTIPGDPKL
jgi:hypothetical protein